MRYAVGYQLADEGEDSIVDIVRDYREQVAEVYFPWTDMASGRAALATRRGYTDWTAQARLEEDLVALRALGVRLDLLLNANCYGGLAVSEFLANQVTSLLEHLEDLVGGADVVTTTSPFVAHVIKERFPQVETRASVNMRIGTVQGFSYVADLFDGYYVLRDHNRDLERIGEIKEWADAHDKRLLMLVNSGCLYACSGQTFHDNLVAHEREADEVASFPGFLPHTCWRLFRDREHWPAFLQATWVRPEDVHHYDGLFQVGKLATRMHAQPRMVVDAYVQGVHHGNLLDLMEPAYSRALAPYVVMNDRFPADWFARTSSCDRRCTGCGYCAEVLERTLVRMEM
jgi:collagenase-like PrtC family protease